MVRFKLIQGLTDPEIKEHILSEEDKSLDETVKAIEAKESGKIARKTIGVPTSPAKINLMVREDSDPQDDLEIEEINFIEVLSDGTKMISVTKDTINNNNEDKVHNTMVTNH